VFEIPSVPSGRKNQSFSSRGLSSLSSSIKSINAKMILVKQDITSTFSTLPDASRQNVFDVYDSIGQELHSLLNDWKSGRNELIHLFDPRSLSSPELEDQESIADSGLGISIAENIDESRKRDSCGDWGVGGLSSPIVSELGDIFEEEAVLEGTAKGRNASNLTRAQRIEKAKKEREDAAEIKKIAQERVRWLGELKDVLDRRTQ
jgi:hypothetical protein